MNAISDSITRGELIDLLNADLALEVDAVNRYATASRLVVGTENAHLSSLLKAHADIELAHAVRIAGEIDLLGGSPWLPPIPGFMTDKPAELLRGHVAAEAFAIERYNQRISQCIALGEHKLADCYRELLMQEQDKLASLVGALATSVDCGYAVVACRQ